MTHDTIAGPGGFPLTRHSAILRSASDDPEVRRRGFDEVVSAYWRPVYKYLRLRWRLGSDDAQDHVQGFFTHALECDTLARFDPSRAHFRTFVRTCIDSFVLNERKAAGRIKRGGHHGFVSLGSQRFDPSGLEREIEGASLADDDDLDGWFHREWIRGVFEVSLARLAELAAEKNKQAAHRAFVRYDLEGPEQDPRPTYAGIAEELGLPVTQVTNHLSWARGELRRILLEHLASITGSAAEAREEARAIFGDSES